MATINSFYFIPNWIGIKFYDSETVSRSLMLHCEVSQVPTDVSLRYEIITDGVNVEILNSSHSHTMQVTEDDFRKEIKFKKKASGVKKDFYVKVTASTSNDSAETRIKVKYA